MRSLSLMILLLCAVEASAQLRRWGSGSCDQFDRVETRWEWKPASETFADNTEDRYTLWRDGRFVGLWFGDEGYYRPWLGGESWGPRVDAAPVTVAEWMRRKPDIKGGVDASKLRGADGCECHLNGQPSAAGFKALVDALDDDSQKLWLVVTGDNREAFVAKLRADPKMNSLLSRCRVWSVPATHHSILDRDTKRPMFPVGSPGVFLGNPDGVELFKGDGAVMNFDALRKADPLFRPEPKPAPVPVPQPVPVQPSPKQPDVKPDTPVDNNPVPMCCLAMLGGAVAVYVAFKKGQQ